MRHRTTAPYSKTPSKQLHEMTFVHQSFLPPPIDVADLLLPLLIPPPHPGFGVSHRGEHCTYNRQRASVPLVPRLRPLQKDRQALPWMGEVLNPSMPTLSLSLLNSNPELGQRTRGPELASRGGKLSEGGKRAFRRGRASRGGRGELQILRGFRNV